MSLDTNMLISYAALRRAVCGTRGSLRTMHGGGSAPSCCAFPHRVRFYFNHKTHPQLSVIWPSYFVLSGLLVLVVVLRSSPGAYWTPSDLGDSCFSVISFSPFIQFMRFSRQVYWGGLPFPPPVCVCVCVCIIF